MSYTPITHISTDLGGKPQKNGGASKAQSSLPFIRVLSKVSGETQRPADARSGGEPPATPLASLLTTMKQLGLPVKDGKLPVESVPTVRTALMGCGLGREQVDSLLKRCTTEGGDISVETLVAALIDAQGSRAPEAGSLLVRRDQRVPLEGVLASLGLPPETISRLTREAQTSQGDIDVGRLSQGLQRFSNQFADVDLVELLRDNGIPVTTPRALSGRDKQEVPTDLGEAKASTAVPQRDHQERLELASRLRQEGFLPEQVKSILERLQYHRRNFDHSASSDGIPAAGKIDATEAGGLETNPSAVNRPQPRLAGDQGELSTPALSARPRPVTLPSQGEKTVPGQQQGEVGRALGHAQYPQPDLDEGKTTKPALSTGQTPVQPERGGQPLRGGELLREALGVVRMPGPAASLAQPTASARGTAFSVRGVDLEPYLQVAQRLVHMTANGEYLTRLHLHPPELGRIGIEIRLDENRLKVALVTESSAAKELMEAQLPQLRQHLVQNNLQLQQFQVTVGPDLSPFQRSHRDLDQKGHGNEQPGTSASAEKVDELQEIALHPGVWGNDHRIDLFA